MSLRILWGFLAVLPFQEFSMGKEFRYMCLVKTRRLLLLMGIAFGLILFVQYFELPYSSILSSLFAPGKSHLAPVDNLPNKISSSNSTTSRNLEYFISLNSTDLNVADEVSSTDNISDGKDNVVTDVKDDFDPENNKTFDDSSNYDIDPEDEFPSKDFLGLDHKSTSERVVRNTSFPSETTGETDDELPKSEHSLESSSSLEHNGVGDVTQRSEENENENTGPSPVTISPSNYPPVASPENPEAFVDSSSPITSMGEHAKSLPQNIENDKILKAYTSAPVSDPSIIRNPAKKEELKRPLPVVVPISEMNHMLLQSHVSYRALKPRWSSPVDQELLNTRPLIENAPIIENNAQLDVKLYRNFSAFKRSYELMEQTLKVYIYAEGERPIFHQPPLKGIYASEGWFMKQLKSYKRFVTKNPKKAHLFYLPFSSRMLEVTLYVPNSHDRKSLIEHLSNYVEMITTKYHFWNRTAGADHFLVACHDWAPAETRQIMANCIRALCNADVREGFQFGKDASLPETFVQSPRNPLRQLGGKPPSKRSILAFFAGNMHGYLRPILLKYWENKDPDVKIFGPIPKVKGQMSYAQYMKSSKYCICAKGFEVNSPRVVEAIFYECVPVIISDNFVPPFFETLNWESFAVFVSEKDIPNLKNILLSISKKRYLEMQQRVKQVQQHFLWHPRPVKYDVFHMILHSIWYNRVFQTRSW
ncbi:probable glycosyltransferase At5g25310 isoform X1 [Sesamum indicum]|uniref:Probable glycosyltransferase At5g25310 isoform X1 n=2 Tax=Sesamum indicum TaxID=4182 RepID=A0A6I9TAT8_SESIN|nr:probable glycosyltransferase At5g25310 isoform X1 [Sesamum indicum]